MNLCELFLSIEGEGKRTGIPAVFIRKTRCNLNPCCSYCDSVYSFKKNPEGDSTVYQIMSKIYELGQGCKSVTLTGGEPLYCTSDTDRFETQDLINNLTYGGFEVNVETNGSIDLKPWVNLVKNSGFFTMDWKCFSSGVSPYMLPSNLKLLDEDDVLKFVVGTEEDLEQMKTVLSAYEPRAQVYVSPVFGKMSMKRIVQYVLDNRLYQVKLGFQLHKYVWDPEARGV